RRRTFQRPFDRGPILWCRRPHIAARWPFSDLIHQAFCNHQARERGGWTKVDVGCLRVVLGPHAALPAAVASDNSGRAGAWVLHCWLATISGHTAEGQLMANVVVVGAQWGDEGKGKIVDWLSEQADIVVRFQGGHNAGHTLVIDGTTYKLSLLP